MTKQEIVDVLAKNASSNRTALKFTLVVGIIALLGGIALLVFGEDPGMWTYIIIGGGTMFISGSIIRLKANTPEKDAARIREIFDYRPQELVWAYTQAIKGSIATTKTVIMKFRDGTEFEIQEDAIPSKQCNDLVAALVVINPKMVVGYSEETAQLYKNKQL